MAVLEMSRSAPACNLFSLPGDSTCTFPENTELAAIGQGVVSTDFSAPTGERPSRARRGSPK